jgi:hypothetical protein
VFEYVCSRDGVDSIRNSIELNKIKEDVKMEENVKGLIKGLSLAEYKKQWLKNNKEKVSEYRRRFFEKNPGYLKGYYDRRVRKSGTQLKLKLDE